MFLYREESGGTINKIVKPGEVHALGQKGRVGVEFEVIIEDAAVRNEGFKDRKAFWFIEKVHS